MRPDPERPQGPDGALMPPDPERPQGPDGAPMRPDPERLRATVERLEGPERPPASPGERAAAAWIRTRFDALGAPARIEAEPAVGSFPLPIGLLSAIGAAAGLGRAPR